jgi:membrane protein DedA with SNARE-associated domain
MNLALLIIVAVIAAVLSALAVHFLGRRHILAAMEQKGLHLVCGECKLLVARYEQLPNGSILCANCRRKIERMAESARRGWLKWL